MPKTFSPSAPFAVIAAPPPAYNARAQFYFDQYLLYVGVAVDSGRKTLVNDFTDALIAAGFIHATDTTGASDQIQAIHLMDAGGATETRLNLLRPLDLDAAWRLTYGGGWTYSANGAVPNGVNAFCNTHWKPLTQAAANPGWGVYSRTNDKTGTQVYGVFDSTPAPATFAQQNFSNENMFSGPIGALMTYSRPTTQRLFLHVVRSDVDAENYQDGTSIGAGVGPGCTNTPNLEFYYGARNSTIGPTNYSGHEISLGMLFNTGFSSAQALALNTIINDWAVANGWNV